MDCDQQDTLQTQNRPAHTLDKARQALRHVADHHLAAPVLKEAVERRCLRVFHDGIAQLRHATSASLEQGHFIPCNIMQEKPWEGGEGVSFLSFRLGIGHLHCGEGGCEKGKDGHSPSACVGQSALVGFDDGGIV